MSSDRREDVVSDLMLERYRLGELSEIERARIAARAAADPAVAERLQALEQSDAEINGRHLVPALARAIRARSDRSTSSRRPILGLIALSGVTAALVLAVTLRPGPQDRVDRIKGLAPSLVVYRQTPHGSERVADDSLAHTGDVLRLGYIAAGARYGVIVSVDGRGVVTTHLPKTADRAAELTDGSQVLLDQAYELDDAPAIERFYFVTGPSPFAVADVRTAATRATAGHPGTAPARLELPKDLKQFTIAVRKD